MPPTVQREAEPSKLPVLLEVVGVFALTLLAVALVARLPLARWGRTALLRPCVEHLAPGLVPVLGPC